MAALRTDWENTVSTDIGGLIRIDLPEFWTVEEQSSSLGRFFLCDQPDLDIADVWGGFSIDIRREPVDAESAARYAKGLEEGVIAGSIFPKAGASNETDFVRTTTLRMAVLNGETVSVSFVLEMRPEQSTYPEFAGLADQMRHASLAATFTEGRLRPTYADVYGDAASGEGPHPAYAQAAERRPPDPRDTVERFISEYIEIDLPRTWSAHRIAPLAWRLSDVDSAYSGEHFAVMVLGSGPIKLIRFVRHRASVRRCARRS